MRASVVMLPHNHYTLLQLNLSSKLHVDLEWLCCQEFIH